MQLFNPMALPPFPGNQPRPGIPWGAGVLPVQGQVPITVPPTVHFPAGLVPPQIQVSLEFFPL